MQETPGRLLGWEDPWVSLVTQLVKNHLQCGDLGSILGLGRSLGGGKGYPLQYSGLENYTDCTVHGFPKSRTRLRDFHFHQSQKLKFP